jgi:hypothetical protein
MLFWRELNRLAHGFKEAAFIGFPGSRYTECSPVIDRCSHHWQTYRDVYAGLQSEHFHRPVALIVIHSDDQVEVAALRAIEERISGERALHVPAAAATRFDCRHDLFFFFPVSEEAIFSGVGIDAADPDAGSSWPGG